MFNAASKSEKISRDKSTRLTILICDDLKDIVQVCILSLRTRYTLLTASSGEECLSIYIGEVSRGRNVDLVLLDYKLGDMSGEEVATKIKGIRPTKVVLMTAFEFETEAISALRDRKLITSDIKKPFSLRDLHKTIDAALSIDAAR